MRTFTLIWCGQLASTMGSYMTFFALTLWTWEQTESATALTLITFCLQLPQIITTLFAGLVVDRFNRKHLMLLGDALNAVATASVGLLFLTQQ
ncbi:MAG: MFS transporter, partial [Cyanobacteria bacterium P01_D01_bin.73]